jgi:hypothetical protein
LQNIALAKLRRALAKREKPIVRRNPIQRVDQEPLFRSYVCVQLNTEKSIED